MEFLAPGPGQDVGPQTRLVLDLGFVLGKAFYLGTHGQGTNFPSGEEVMQAEVNCGVGIELVWLLPTD